MGDAAIPSAPEDPVALPAAEVISLKPGISLQPPLSRRGHGPGIVIVVPDSLSIETENSAEILWPLQKWAEEGFAVVEIRAGAIATEESSISSLRLALSALKECSTCDKEIGVGIIVFDPSLWIQIKPAVEANPEIVATVCYGECGESELSPSSKPFLHHFAGASKLKRSQLARGTIHEYPGISSSLFAFPGQEFRYSSEAVSHTRTLSFLKKLIGAPLFDLEAIWEEHTYYEFADRSVAKTMGTMVQEPYVNHIPTMAGGIGRKELTSFYAHHFIWNNPRDTEIDLVSRTVGVDRVCDEFVFKFTHDTQVDWLLPGIPPTGKKLSIPFTSIVNIRGDRLYHEHIAWDQATVLVQLGLMPEYLPFPYDLPDGKKPAEGHKFEYRVPAAGIETATKMLDRSSISSNEMLKFKIREVKK